MQVRAFIFPFFTVLMMYLEYGWPWSNDITRNRLSIMNAKGNFKHKILPGSHHFHIDPGFANGVAEEVITFIKNDK